MCNQAVSLVAAELERRGIATVTIQILRYAGRAIQLAEETLGGSFEPAFLERLAEAPSNLPQHKDGRDLYEKCVRPTVVE